MVDEIGAPVSSEAQQCNEQCRDIGSAPVRVLKLAPAWAI